MTSTDTLLPCPFCGGAAEMRGGGMINCQRCGAEAFGPKWQRRTPPTPATEEREAVALAMLNGKRLREGWPITASIPEGFVDGDEWRLEAQDALSALAPIRAQEIAAARAEEQGYRHTQVAALKQVHAAEILAAEANERARIVAWLRATSTGLDLTNRRIADAIERNERGAGK